MPGAEDGLRPVCARGLPGVPGIQCRLAKAHGR